MHGSLFLCQTASGIRFMRQQIAGTTPTRLRSFHTASGMRSHVTSQPKLNQGIVDEFQYRKRYEVTCDTSSLPSEHCFLWCFNTASGMRSHVTRGVATAVTGVNPFQYRKRYEVTCDPLSSICNFSSLTSFNTASGMRSHVTAFACVDASSPLRVSIPQAV